MHFLLVIYVFILFILFTNNSLFARFFSFKGKQLPSHLVSAFAFAIVLYFTYDYIHPHHKESMILFNKNNVGGVLNEETENISKFANSLLENLIGKNLNVYDISKFRAHKKILHHV